MSGDDSSLSLRAPARETVFRPFPLASPSGALYIERKFFLRRCIDQSVHYLRHSRSLYSNTLDNRPIPRPIRWIICQSLARGAHSSSGITERVRRPHQIQVRTAAPPSAYNGHNSRRVQQLHRARTMATTGAHSSSTERVRQPQQ